MVTLSLSETAYNSLKELPPHDGRKQNYAYLGYSGMITEQTERQARGLAKLIESFFLLHHQPVFFDNSNYHTNQYEYRRMLRNDGYPTNWPTIKQSSHYHTKLSDGTYRIIPSLFEDRRDESITFLEPDLGWVPGQPIPIAPAGNPVKEWPAWSDGDSTTQRKLTFTYNNEVLDAAWDIAMYWHIGTIKRRSRPTSKVQALSGVLEAIGQEYLWHPLLPPQYSLAITNRRPLK